jgi:hypothetical protein
MRLTRRYGTSPAQRGCGTNNSCPDVLRLDNGDYLVIGAVADLDGLKSQLADLGAGIGENEAAVVVPAKVVEAAAREIASQTTGIHVP